MMEKNSHRRSFSEHIRQQKQKSPKTDISGGFGNIVTLATCRWLEIPLKWVGQSFGMWPWLIICI